jgi:hypothetical protein
LIVRSTSEKRIIFDVEKSNLAKKKGLHFPYRILKSFLHIFCIIKIAIDSLCKDVYDVQYTFSFNNVLCISCRKAEEPGYIQKRERGKDCN